MAFVRHLVMDKSSLLPDPSMYKHGASAFFDVFGLFMITLPMRLVVMLNSICSVGGMVYVLRRMAFSRGMLL